MALHDVKPAPVTLDLDKPRTLVFDLNAFSELEDKYGTMENAFAAMQTGSMKAARTLLWAGLLHEDDNLTEKQVGGMVALDNMESVMNAITLALTAAMPQDATESDVEGTPADPT